MEPLRQKDPKTIGPYTLIGRLGAGGMGIVYLASKGSESVALKVVRESLIDDPSDATRFAREIEALEAIASPYVAKILGSGVEGDQAWFATEFVNGPDLKSLVSDKGPLDKEKWQSLADGVLKGLEAIHAAGVIHRDIKPGNIIMSETGPKIIDFGIAQVSDATSVTSSGLVAGSPAWFSPEQIEGQVLTPATDLFSAGSVLVYAATGSSPWGDETTITKASVFKILTAEPNLDGLSEKQRELVEKLMAKEPEKRGNKPVSALPRKAAVPDPSIARAQNIKGQARERKIPGAKGVSIAVISILALVSVGLGIAHISPASGNLNVYLTNKYDSSNPVIGDLVLTIHRDNRLPIEVPLDDGNGNQKKFRYKAVGEWEEDSEFKVELSSSFSQDSKMETDFFLSDASISGLIRDPQVAIKVSVGQTDFQIEILAPELSGGAVRYVQIQRVSFPRGNEKEAIDSCRVEETDSLNRKYSEAINLGSEWNSAKEESGLNRSGSALYTTWASRGDKLRNLAVGLTEAVELNSPRGIHPALDQELDKVLQGARSQIEAIKSFSSFSRQIAYDIDNNPRWDPYFAAADVTPASFSTAKLKEVSEEICGEKIF